MKLVLGTMTFGESVFAPSVSEFVEMFLNAGYEELDTAYVYNEGNSEKLLGEVLPRLRYPYKISTKVNPRITGKLDGEAAYSQLNGSLKRLGVPTVDTFYLHFPDPATPMESVLEVCNNLYQEGKFRELGLSNFPAWMVADVWHICYKNGWVLPTVFEGIYNPLTRKAETELNACLNYFRMRFYDCSRDVMEDMKMLRQMGVSRTARIIRDAIGKRAILMLWKSSNHPAKKRVLLLSKQLIVGLLIILCWIQNVEMQLL